MELVKKNSNPKGKRHIQDRFLSTGLRTAFTPAIIISLFLLINTHYYNSLAIAQRTTSRSNETLGLEEESTSPSPTTESQSPGNETPNTNKPSGT